MKRWLREPLIQFLVLGAAFFLLNGLLGRRDVEAGERVIHVQPGRIENLAALFAKTWQRPPTAQELRGLVDDYVLEEALYREGLALGMDRDDAIIRRRLRQKMEFVANDIVELAEPTEAELEAWLATHPESYARPAHYRFRQVFLDPARRGDKLEADAKRVLAELRELAPDADPRGLGDSSLLEHAFEDVRADVVARAFGDDFAAGLAKLPFGQWAGPVESAFGLHLVFIDACTKGRATALAEVRAAVERDFRHDRQQKASKSFHQEILARYRVVIEWPQVPDGKRQ